MAEVARPDWTQLAHSANAAGIVRIESVRYVAGYRTAVGTVVEPVMGLDYGERIAVMAHPLWTCDDSNAHEGETVFLWLDDIDRHPRFDASVPIYRLSVNATIGNVPIYGICWSGWGRRKAEQRADGWWISTPQWRNWPSEFDTPRTDAMTPVTRVASFVRRVAAASSNDPVESPALTAKSLGFGSSLVQLLAALSFLAAGICVWRLLARPHRS